MHLGVEFLKEMAILGAIQGISKDVFEAQYAEWTAEADRTAYYNKYFDDYYTSRLFGVKKDVFEEAGRKVAEHVSHTLYIEVLDELKHHQAEGRFILVISKSPEQAVSHIAGLLKVDDYWGWQFNFDSSNKYVNQFVYPNGESDKAYIIQDMVNKHSLTLDDSYAYGDSNGDISMLQLVKNSIAVNPEPGLLAIARKNSWRVLMTTALQ